MTVRVGINGFGRIGRNVLRAIKEYNRTDITVVAINDVGDLKTNVHLLKYDSVHGPFHGEVRVEGDGFDIGTGHIKVLSERDPSKLPWASTGRRHRDGMHRHFLRQGQGVRASHRRREESAGIGAVERCGHHRRLWREPRQAYAAIIRSSRTPPAPPTAWRRWRRC